MEQGQLEDLASEFYRALFSAQENLEPDLVCQYVPKKVIDLMNEILDRPFVAEEVEHALFQMGPNKSPGPDGFTAGFFFKNIGP